MRKSSRALVGAATVAVEFLLKSHTEGMRSFVYYVASLFDKEACAENNEEKTYTSDLISLLTPVIKAYCTDRGFECTVQAMQVYGGYGYSRDYPIERLVRDSKINSIYEGANGIQAMDLLGRKLGMKKGAVFMNFLSEIRKTTAKAGKTDGLSRLAEQVEGAANRLAEIAAYIGKTALSSDVKIAFAHTTPFLEVFGDIILAWMHLWRATVAAPELTNLLKDAREKARLEKINTNKNAAFYEGLMKSAEYFIQTILPVTMGKMASIEANCASTVEIPEKSFGGI